MLRKRSGSDQKDQQMVYGTGSDSVSQSEISGKRNRNSSFFSVPGVFVGLNPKGFPDSDSVRSPKSPLDFRVFSSFGSPFRSPLSPSNGSKKNWGCSSKVGLSIIDSLNKDSDVDGGGVLRSSSDGKTILFGPQMRSRRSRTPKTYIDDSFEVARSLPKNYVIKESSPNKGISGVVFEIADDPFDAELGKFRSCSLDSCRSFLSVPGLSELGVQNMNHSLPSEENSNPKIDPPPECVLASELELDEDYTCVISHGPNPKTTHIYGDCVLKCDGNVLRGSPDDERKKLESPRVGKSSITRTFLSFCNSCNKKLEEGKDIYIYRGEKSFCSLECRSRAILIDEEMDDEASKAKTSSEISPDVEDDELFETGMFIAK